jgi:hypothetical protein
VGEGFVAVDVAVDKGQLVELVLVGENGFLGTEEAAGGLVVQEGGEAEEDGVVDGWRLDGVDLVATC